MRPRDHYLAAIIARTSNADVRLLSYKPGDHPDGCSGHLVACAIRWADEMAKQACKAWGHDWEINYDAVAQATKGSLPSWECFRCGERREAQDRPRSRS